VTEWLAVVPLVICAAGAVLPAIAAWGPVNRRLTPEALSLGMALAPAAAFFFLLWHSAAILERPVSWAVPWIPSLGISFAIYLDGLSLAMALVVTGIGTLVTIYGGAYFHGDRTAWKFLLYLALFQVAMLGLVMAGDFVVLFVFWELTSVTSFLLIGYKQKDPKAQHGAFKSLVITGGGGIALLVGVLVMASVTGTTSVPETLAAGNLLRSHDLYPFILVLVALGAFAKSAQFPFHTWLPDGMTAPTPASAFLHSATMVKAGIYLLARLNPALGLTEPWFWLLTSVGLVTMLVGAWLAFQATDLKGVLAYTTVSQLGTLTMLIGQDTSVAYQGFAVGLLAHALYKSALFMVAGSVDHATGTRDMRRLGGLARVMPFSFGIALLAGFSMAGFPPMFGYLAKDALVASAAHPTLPVAGQWILTAAAVAGGAMMTALACIFVWETFLERPGDPDTVAHAHEVPWGMWVGAGTPAVLSLLIVIAPLTIAQDLLTGAAEAALGQEVPIAFTIWKGLDFLKVLGVVAIALGLAAFAARASVRGVVRRTIVAHPAEALYTGALRAIDAGAWLATRLQNGQLRRYLTVMLVAVALLVAWTGGWPELSLNGLRWDQPFPVLRVFALFLAAAAALVSVFLRKDLYAILSIGTSGFGVALVFLLEPAPDVALVMLVVDVLTMVVLVMALTKLPPPQRREADSVDFQDTRIGDLRDAAVATVAGFIFAGVTLAVLVGRPGESLVSPFYLAEAKTLVGASDAVGAIVVDFRAFDTLLEIVVFALAGVGIYTLVYYASPAAGDLATERAVRSRVLDTPFTRMLASLVLPLTLVLAMTHVMYGHAQPGDGFTAGVIVSLAVAFRYAVLGSERSRVTKPWLRPLTLAALGLTLALAGATIGYLARGSFFAHYDLGAAIGLPLPYEVALSTSLLFELAIAVAVIGGASLVIDTLSGDEEEEERAEIEPPLEGEAS
jgi:multicomponent K+:H+ antiporter subunit A